MTFSLLTINLSTQFAYAYGDFIKPERIFRDYKNEKKRHSILSYFNGLIGAYGWANTELRIRELKPLYCPSQNESISVLTAYKLYKNEYLSNKKLYDSLEHNPPGFMLLNALKKEYPC